MANGRVRFEPKRQMKSRGIRSADLGDALALTFAELRVMRAVDWDSLPAYAEM